MWLVSFFLDKPSGCGEALMQAHTRSGCAMRGLLQSDSKWLLLEPASNACLVLLAFGSNKRSCSGGGRGHLGGRVNAQTNVRIDWG